jgi:hypothetical protein
MGGTGIKLAPPTPEVIEQTQVAVRVGDIGLGAKSVADEKDALRSAALHDGQRRALVLTCTDRVRMVNPSNITSTLGVQFCRNADRRCSGQNLRLIAISQVGTFLDGRKSDKALETSQTARSDHSWAKL